MFRSGEDDGIHWAAGMALRLLEECRACRESQADSQWCVWIDSLPAPGEVLTPLGYSDAEVVALGDPGVVAEVQGMQDCIRACYEATAEELNGGDGGGERTSPASTPLISAGITWPEFLWAVQVFTSRCFFEPSVGGHLAVPGVDMANHSFAPTASVQVSPWQRSGGKGQGGRGMVSAYPLLFCNHPQPLPRLHRSGTAPHTARAGMRWTRSASRRRLLQHPQRPRRSSC